MHEQFALPLNGVILEKINLRTQVRAHVILFSSDLTLAAAALVDYYRLRFQKSASSKTQTRFLVASPQPPNKLGVHSSCS